MDLEAFYLRLRTEAEPFVWPADNRIAEIVMREPPEEDHPPRAWTLTKNAGRVCGTDGALLESHPNPPK